MQRIGFTAPALDSLLKQASSLSDKYHLRRTQDANPIREQQICEIAALHREFQAWHNAQSNPGFSNEALRNISLGIWVAELECIEQEYSLRNPLPSESRVFPFGSVLFELITTALNLTSENQLNDELRLMYLAEAHQFLSTQKENAETLKHIEKAMSFVLTRMLKSIKKLMDAIPTPEVLQKQFETFYSSYAKKRLTTQPFYAPKVNDDRPFCAQLGQVIAGMLNVSMITKNVKEMDRQHRVLLGLLICMMRTINSDRSTLYQLCKSMMNGGPETLSPAVQFDCLLTLENFLKDSANQQQLVEEGKKLFGNDNRLVNLDTKLRIVIDRIEKELTVLSPDQPNPMVGARIFAAAGAMAIYPVGYGVGSVLGKVAAGAEVRVNTGMKEFLTGWINQNAHYLFGVRGNGVGYLAITPMVTAVYQTVAGNVLGTTFAFAGGAIAGGVGYLMIDLLLRQLYQHMAQSTMGYKDPLYALNFNSHVLACLEQLPDSILAAEKKQKMSRVTGHSCRLMNHSNQESGRDEVKTLCGINLQP